MQQHESRIEMISVSVKSSHRLLSEAPDDMVQTVTRMQQVNLPVRVSASWWPDCTHQVLDTCFGSYAIHFDCAQNNYSHLHLTYY